jgi:hypothetical protein
MGTGNLAGALECAGDGRDEYADGREVKGRQEAKWSAGSLVLGRDVVLVHVLVLVLGWGLDTLAGERLEAFRD